MTSISTGTPRLRPYALVLITLIVAEATGAFEAAMLSSAVPKMIADFGITTADMGWAFSGFLLVGAASAAIGGRLGDLFGRKRVLMIVLVVSIIGSLVSILIGTFPAIIAGRSIQGVSAAVLPLIIGIAREAVVPKRVPLTIAVVAGTVTIAGSLGFLVSGYLVQFSTWHAIFIASGVLAAIATVLALFTLNRSPVTHQKGEKLDFFGGVLFVPALALILFGVTKSQGVGWTSPVVLGCVGAGAALLVIWAWWELRVPKPLLNLRLLGRPKYALTVGIIAALAFGSMGGMQLVTPILLQAPTTAPVGLGLTPSAFGTLSLVLGIVGYVFAPLSGLIAGRAGAKRSMLIGILILLVGFPGYIIFRDNLFVIAGVMLLQGAGITFALTSVPNLLAEAIPKANMSEGMGFAVVARSTAQAIGISVFSVALSSAVVPGTALPQLSVFVLVIVMAIVGIAVALVLVLLIKGGKAKLDDNGEVIDELAAGSPAPAKARAVASAANGS
jgi:MFS family permease